MVDDAVTSRLESCGPALDAVGIHEGERVLDLGCGSGRELLQAASLVGKSGLAIGLDIDPLKIERAGAAVAQAGTGNVELYLGDARCLPLDSGVLDAVYSNCVLNLISDKSQVFAEVRRVLKPQGRLVFADIVAIKRNIDADTLRSATAILGCCNGVLHIDEYLELLSSSGFAELRSKPYAAIPFSLLERLAKKAANDTALEKSDRWLLNDALASVLFYCSNSSMPKRVAS